VFLGASCYHRDVSEWCNCCVLPSPLALWEHSLHDSVSDFESACYRAEPGLLLPLLLPNQHHQNTLQYKTTKMTQLSKFHLCKIDMLSGISRTNLCDSIWWRFDPYGNLSCISCGVCVAMVPGLCQPVLGGIDHAAVVQIYWTNCGRL